MTKRPASTKEQKIIRNEIYHRQFEVHPRNFFYIKLADRMHNLLTMWCWDAFDIKRKLEETKLYYLPYAKKHCILVHEMQAAIKLLEEKANAELSALFEEREVSGGSGERKGDQGNEAS